MNLDEFLQKLHYETDKITPPDWEVNWDDAPLPYKLYQGLPAVNLDAEISNTLERTTKPNIKDISHFLWYTFGLTQVSQSYPFSDQSDPWTTCRRFVPSGGALYPNELYMYLKIDGLTDGIYHYDAAHHRLVCLREGNFDDYLARALGNRCDISSCFGTVFISTFFWKNFFKYHNFSYRLQGLDAGFVLGQMLEVSRRLGFESGVYYHFLDRALNHLIGLNVLEESVYAVIPFSINNSTSWFRDPGLETITAKKLCSEIEEVHHKHFMRSKEIRAYPMLLKMNEACMMDSFRALPAMKNEQRDGGGSSFIKLPPANRLSYDFSSACRSRYSPGLDFVLKPIYFDTLSELLNETMQTSSYRNDLDGSFQLLPYRVSLCLSSYRIDGLPNGLYTYDGLEHGLKKIAFGDFRNSLQDGLLSDFVNMAQIPLSFNFVGEKDHYQRAYGYRGHRIQHMETGILGHGLLLAASALNIGGHPVLGFHVHWYDELHQLNQVEKTSLLHIPIGFYRNHPRLQGSLRM